MVDEVGRILDDLQGAVLAVEELNSTIPDVQMYYNKCQELVAQLDKRKEEVSSLIAASDGLREEIRKQSSGTSKELEIKIEKATSQIDAAIKKIERMHSDIERKIKDIPSVDPLKKQLSVLEKEIKRIDEKIDNLETDVTEEDLDDLRDEIFEEIEKRFADLQKEIIKQNLANLRNSTASSSQNTPIRVNIPSGYLSCSLSSTKDVRRKKPYGVLFEETGTWVLASHWTDLTEKMTIYIIEHYAQDGGKCLRDSEKDDGWGHYYFWDKSVNGYTYIPKYQIAVYKASALDSLEIYKYMCEEYGINKSKVKVYYK